MKPAKEPRPDALDFVHDLFAEEEADSLAELPPDERHAQMRARGIDPARAQALLAQVLAEHEHMLAEHERIVTERPPPDVQPGPIAASGPVQAADAVELHSRRPLTWLALAIAAGFAMAAGAFAAPTVMAWLTPKPPAPVPTLRSPEPPPSPQEVAAGLRREALSACAERDYAACESRLDRAKEIDPAGEEAVQVRDARAKIREAKDSVRKSGPKQPLQ